MARILDGDYAGNSDGVLTLVSAPPETRYFVGLIEEIIEKARAGAEAEEIVSDLEEISPKLSEAARHVIRKGGLSLLIALLLSFLTACDIKFEVKGDANRGIDQLFYHLMGHEPMPEPRQSTGPKGGEPTKTDIDSIEEPASTGTVDASPKETPSKSRQTVNPQSQLSHHKSIQSKRQKRRAAQRCGPKPR